MVVSRLLQALDRLWCIGRRSQRCYVRFYPNPGVMLNIAGRELKFSKHYGFSAKRAR